MMHSDNNINVEDIVKKIRVEVRKRKKELNSPKGENPATKTDSSRHFEKSYTANLTGYDLNELLSYQDKEFIEEAYKILLGYTPDPDGMNDFLNSLRNGSRTKLDILAGIRYHSKHGIERGVYIKGLRVHYLLNKVFNIPFFGYFIKYITIFFRLPFILNTINKLDVKTEANYINNKSLINNNFKSFHNEIAELRNEIAELEENRKEIHQKLIENNSYILEQQRLLSLIFDEVKKRLPEQLSPEQLKTILKEEDHIFDVMYVLFEDRFRGTREEIKNRLRVYLQYFNNNVATIDSPVLDIGCGRGEWLELLNENGSIARGIDINRTMIRQCAEMGFDAVESNAITYLHDQKTNSLGAITGFHIVEHLQLKELLLLFDETLRTLKPGGFAVFETPNPENIIVGSCNFYIDPTHRNPIPPVTLKFLLEARGFVNIEIIRLHPLNYIDIDVNTGIDKIISAFNAPLDYSIIAYKE